MATFYESLSPKIEGFKKSGAIALLFSWHKFGKQRSCLLFPLPPVFVPDERLVRDFGCRIKGEESLSAPSYSLRHGGSMLFSIAKRMSCGISFAPCESVYLNIAGTIRYNKGE
ncbi:MAG: hypothetical protein C6W57_08970 [Caldibacillus debilis]|nr:MAG: hypothetical protein C6W57_08970 [Caldibacillus debilis]